MAKGMIGMLAVAFVAMAVYGQQAQTKAPPLTKVELKELHCLNCAKKIATEVHKVDGVAEMRVDLKQKLVFVVHKSGQTPSAKKLWEAIEEADHEPVKMETPTATHQKKPEA